MVCFWDGSLWALTHRSAFLWVISIMGSLASCAGLQRLGAEAGHTRWAQCGEVHREDNICAVSLRNRMIKVWYVLRINMCLCLLARPIRDFDMDVEFYLNYLGNIWCTYSIACSNCLQVFVLQAYFFFGPCPCLNPYHTRICTQACMSEWMILFFFSLHSQNVTRHPEPRHEAL